MAYEEAQCAVCPCPPPNPPEPLCIGAAVATSLHHQQIYYIQCKRYNVPPSKTTDVLSQQGQPRQRPVDHPRPARVQPDKAPRVLPQRIQQVLYMQLSGQRLDTMAVEGQAGLLAAQKGNASADYFCLGAGGVCLQLVEERRLRGEEGGYSHVLLFLLLLLLLLDGPFGAGDGRGKDDFSGRHGYLIALSWRPSILYIVLWV